jgi:hypothetical protein
MTLETAAQQMAEAGIVLDASLPGGWSAYISPMDVAAYVADPVGYCAQQEGVSRATVEAYIASNGGSQCLATTRRGPCAIRPKDSRVWIRDFDAAVHGRCRLHQTGARQLAAAAVGQ